MDDTLLKEAELTPITPARAATARPGMAPVALQKKINQFFVDEKVALAMDRGSDDFIVTAGGPENLSWTTQRTDGGTVFVTGRNTLVQQSRSRWNSTTGWFESSKKACR